MGCGYYLGGGSHWDIQAHLTSVFWCPVVHPFKTVQCTVVQEGGYPASAQYNVWLPAEQYTVQTPSAHSSETVCLALAGIGY